MTDMTLTTRRELAHRSSDGIDVTLVREATFGFGDHGASFHRAVSGVRPARVPAPELPAEALREPHGLQPRLGGRPHSPTIRSRTEAGWERNGWWPAPSSTTLAARPENSRCRLAGVPWSCGHASTGRA
jgi:hypothetical protein